MKKEANNRLQKILELKKTIENAENELEALLLPSNTTPLPSGFSFTEEVLAIIIDNTNGISRSNILETLRNKNPNIKEAFDKKQVASALAYLKNTKKLIEIVKRGVYRKIKTPLRNNTSITELEKNIKFEKNHPIRYPIPPITKNLMNEKF